MRIAMRSQIQMGAKRSERLMDEREGLVDRMISVPKDWTPIPTPTTPKYIMVSG